MGRKTPQPTILCSLNLPPPSILLHYQQPREMMYSLCSRGRPTPCSSHTRKRIRRVFKNKDGLRPSRLTLLWSKLLFLPPLTLYCVKTVYASRETIIDLARDALEASRKFVRDWLLEPLRGVYETIRAGREEAVLVRPESVSADLDVSNAYVAERTLIFSSPSRGWVSH